MYLREQRRHPPPAGNDERRVELGERLEREAPLVQSRMRHRQTRLVAQLVAVDEQIEVDRARTVPLPVADAPELTLDGEQLVEELARGQRRLEHRRAIEIAWLVDDPHGVRLPQARHDDDLDTSPLREREQCTANRRLAVAQVGAQADICTGHNATLTAPAKPIEDNLRQNEGMVSILVAATALALGSHSPAVSSGEYALVQLTPAAVCSETVPLLEAGATSVAPALRVFRLPAGAARRLAPGLRARGALQTLEPDRTDVGTLASVDTPDPLEANEWWRAAIGIDGLTPPGPGTPITIVDSGIDLQHPEFADRPDTLALNSQEPTPLGGEHGTAVASLIGAPQNGVGIVGVYPQANLRSWDAALGTGTRLDSSEIVQGIDAATQTGPGVINLSVGSTQRDPLIEQAIDRAFARGLLVVAAAGNDGLKGSPVDYPAGLPHVLTVAATDSANQVAPFSSRSRSVDLAAPGSDIVVATAIGNGWQSESGTSFAAPLVSGAAAWVWTARPELDNTQLFEVLRQSATDLDPSGRDAASGFGLLNVRDALLFPAPARDPLEPNEDVSFVQPRGFFSDLLRPLTTPQAPGTGIAARLDRREDPRDVYRIWLPARKRLTLTLVSSSDLALDLWGPNTVSVLGGPGVDLLSRNARAGSGLKRIVLPSARRGRWGYLEVSFRSGRGALAAYSLRIGAA